MIQSAFIKLVLPGLLFGIAHASYGQKQGGAWIGLVGGGQVVHVTMTDQGLYENAAKPSGVGWTGAAAGWFDIGKQFVASTSLGVTSEPVRTEGTWSEPGGSQDAFDAKESLTWAEFSASMYFKPIRKTSFSLLAGAGFSIRNLLGSEVKFSLSNGQTVTPYAIDDYLYPWNYAVPLSAGAEFLISGNQKLIVLLGYQIGLRGIYEPISLEPAGLPGYAFEDGYYRLNTTTLRVIYLFKLAAGK
jgi:hypothetical protein